MMAMAAILLHLFLRDDAVAIFVEFRETLLHGGIPFTGVNDAVAIAIGETAGLPFGAARFVQSFHFVFGDEAIAVSIGLGDKFFLARIKLLDGDFAVAVLVKAHTIPGATLGAFGDCGAASDSRR